MSLRSAKDARTGPRDAPDPAPRAAREWRAASAAVTRAWSAWAAATGEQRAPAFDAYTRALAREERAAAALERALDG